MSDSRTALQIILSHGSELDKIRASLFLNERVEEKQQQLLDYYLVRQKPNGAFPFRFRRGGFSSVNTTLGAILMLLKYHLEDSKVFQNALEYILNVQSEEGFWDEDERLLKEKPPAWVVPGKLSTRLWLTAAACYFLVLLNYVPSPHLNKGVNYLLGHKTPSGRLQGYLNTTWIAIAILARLQGKSSKMVKILIQGLQEKVDAITTTEDVIWCLTCLKDAGYKASNDLVAQLLTKLLNRQQPNGLWGNKDEVQNQYSITISALELLKAFDIE